MTDVAQQAGTADAAARRALVQALADARSGETERGPRALLARVVATLGAERTRAFLAETLAVEEAGGSSCRMAAGAAPPAGSSSTWSAAGWTARNAGRSSRRGRSDQPGGATVGRRGRHGPQGDRAGVHLGRLPGGGRGIAAGTGRRPP